MHWNFVFSQTTVHLSEQRDETSRSDWISDSFINLEIPVGAEWITEDKRKAEASHNEQANQWIFDISAQRRMTQSVMNYRTVRLYNSWTDRSWIFALMIDNLFRV